MWPCVLILLWRNDYYAVAELGLGEGGGLGGQPSSFQKRKKNTKRLCYYDRNKGNLSGQGLHCYFYLVALPVFLM